MAIAVMTAAMTTSDERLPHEVIRSYEETTGEDQLENGMSGLATLCGILLRLREQESGVAPGATLQWTAQQVEDMR